MTSSPTLPPTLPSVEQLLAQLQAAADPQSLAGMARFGVNTHHALGVSIPKLRAIAKTTPPNHDLAIRLWDSGLHEARILASFIMPPDQITSAEMDAWAADFDSWDLVDQVCVLFWRTPLGCQKVFEWSARSEEFVKRAAFALMAEFAWYGRPEDHDTLAAFFPVIEAHAGDERNFVKKAVNWALRNLGKNSLALNEQAIACAQRIRQQPSRAARWIAADALRELTGDKVQTRLKAGAARPAR